MGTYNNSLYFAYMLEYSHAQLKLTYYLCTPPTTNREMIYDILIMDPLIKLQYYNSVVTSYWYSFLLSFALDLSRVF